MREVLFNCFGAVNVEENDNGEFVKLSDFEELAKKCSRYIEDYEREKVKCLELKEEIEEISDSNSTQIDKNYDAKQENKKLKYDIDSLKKQLQSSKDEKMELLNRCDELEKQLDYKRELPHSPLETVNFLVHDRYKRCASSLEKMMLGDCEEIEELRYSIDELEQIAEHLLIYCKHNKGCEE